MKKNQKEHSKVKLPLIQEIYNRIILDKRLNKKAFIIGFTDRMSRTGLKEKPLIEWNTGDIEIPWHRIQYIRCGDTKVWDRQQRIDLFASDRLPAEAWAEDLDYDKKDYDSLRKVWKAEKAELFARQPLPGTEGKLFLSDHFALPSVLEYQKQTIAPSRISDALLEKIQTVHPTYHSAIVIIPDEKIWPAIQHLRKQYDRNYIRWMPHITLIYGFVPEELLEAASQLISDVVNGLEEFTITLTVPGTFTQRASTTGWIQPVADTEGVLHKLQTTLQKLFPMCNEQSSRAAGFHPHLTIGQFASEEDARKNLAYWKPVTFNVSSVALISRKGKQPFEVRYKAHLKTGIVEKASI